MAGGSANMLRAWIVVLVLQTCSAVLYHLNDSEHARMPPLFSLDEYSPCLAEEGSTYCMLQLTLHAEPENQLMRMISEYSDHTVKHYNYSIIDRGVCVKSSCPNYISKSGATEDLTSSLEACLNDSVRREYGLSAKVSTLYYCDHHNEPVHIDAWDWTVLGVILGLGIINIIGSIYDYCMSKNDVNQENGNAVLLCFSVKRNWRHLTTYETSDPKIQDLQFFHGTRVISNLFTILMHVFLSFATGFARNTHDIEKAYEYSLFQLFVNGVMIVQLFFFISGFLTAYFLQIEEQKRKLTVWDVPKIMLLRLSRLIPALAMTLAFVTTWARHAGSGPLWKLFVTESMVADCRNYWWHHLIFINNYMAKSKFCLLPTWHLAADMQVFLMGVTAYFLPRRGLAMGSLLLVGAVAPGLHTAFQDLDVTIVTPQPLRNLEIQPFWLQHVLGHNNLPCFVIGMAMGIRIFEWQKKGKHLVKNRWFGLAQYLAVGAIPLVMYSGRVFYADADRAGRGTRAVYVSSLRVVLGLIGTLAVPALFVKTSTHLKSVLDWRHWVVPSRLTYCVFLLHMAFVQMLMGARTDLSFYSCANLMKTYLFIVLVSFLVSLPVHLLVEAPCTGLFKVLVKSPKKILTDKETVAVSGTLNINGTKKEKKL